MPCNMKQDEIFFSGTIRYSTINLQIQYLTKGTH